MTTLNENFKNLALQSALAFVLARIPDDTEGFKAWYEGRSEEWPEDMEVHSVYASLADGELRKVIARTIQEQEEALTEALNVEMEPVKSRLEFYSSQYESVLTALDAASGEHGKWPETPAAVQVRALHDKSQQKVYEATQRAEQYAKVVEGLLDTSNSSPFYAVGHWVEHGPCAAILKDITQNLILDSRGEAQKKAITEIGAVQGVDMMGGRYVGPVVYQNEHHVVQNIGRGMAVIHEKSKFAAETFNEVGEQQKVRIQYSNGRAAVLAGKTQGHSLGH